MNTILFLLITAIAFSIFGAWIAAEKGRPRGQGALIGFLFGPLGALILALLPNKEIRPKATPKPVRAGASRKAVLTAWDIPDDWSPPPPPVAQPSREDEEDRALRYLSGDK